MTTPMLRQQATALQLVAPAGAAVTWQFVLTLPVGVTAITDARFWTYDDDVPLAAVFIDDTEPIIVVAWTAEETATSPLRTGRYVLMVSIDDAPLAPLVGGFLSWIELAQANQSTTATVNLETHVGDNVINVAATFAGPQGPPGSGGGGGAVDSVNGQTGVVILDAADVGAATIAQGATADTAVQPADLAAVATSGAYADLSGKPTLGTAAAQDTTAFDSAGLAAAALVAAQAYTDTEVAALTAGDVGADPAGSAAAAQAFAIQRPNHTGAQAISTVTGLQTALDAKAATSALTAHEADTTAVHGIADTAALVLTSDARLSDARTPTDHITTHAVGGSDPFTNLQLALLLELVTLEFADPAPGPGVWLRKPA